MGEQSPATSPRTPLLAARRTRRERKIRRTKSSGVAASAHLLRPLDRAPSRQSSDGSSDARTQRSLGVWQFLYKSVEGVVVLQFWRVYSPPEPRQRRTPLGPAGVQQCPAIPTKRF